MTLQDLTEDQKLAYAGMLEAKGQAIRLEIMRKRVRLLEVRELPQDQQEGMLAVLVPAFDAIINEKVGIEITVDTVVTATTPATIEEV